MGWKAAVLDRTDPEVCITYRIDEILYREKSKYQEVAVGKLGRYGRALFLDGVIQFVECDERIYHEHLVWPALLYHTNPERVIILGGGDGLALREALRDDRVREAVLCELDQGVIDGCRAGMPDMIEGAFDDPRSRIVVDDALKYLKGGIEKFDVIIIDLVDPYGEEGEQLYRECFELLRPVMKPDTIISTHGESAGPPAYLALRVAAVASKHFPAVKCHRAFVESFAAQWGFMLMSDNMEFADLPRDVIQERLAHFSQKPRQFVPETLPVCHILPPALQAQLDRFKSLPKVVFDREPDIKWFDEGEIPEGLR